MKIRHPTGLVDKVELNMTPMIDVVFQLLAFFIMTLKFVVPEGDFNVKMPLAAPREGTPNDQQIPPIKVRLLAGEGGAIGGILMNERRLSSFDELRNQILAIVGDATGPGSLAAASEVEFDSDYNLKYQHLIEAVTAVSGYVTEQGPVKLIEQIKFAPPRPEP